MATRLEARIVRLERERAERQASADAATHHPVSLVRLEQLVLAFLADHDVDWSHARTPEEFGAILRTTMEANGMTWPAD